MSTFWLRLWQNYCQDSLGDEPHPGPIVTYDLLDPSAGSYGLAPIRDGLIKDEDFVAIPQEAWLKLLDWYGLAKGSRPIARPVFSCGGKAMLKVNLPVFCYQIGPTVRRKSCLLPAITIGQLRRLFLDDQEISVTSLDADPKFSVERDGHVSILEASADEMLAEDVLGNNSVLHIDGSESIAMPGETAGRIALKLGDTSGARGLCNLGNTCFMNSALQCLSNCLPLTMFFLENHHLSQLNRTNPLGTGGALAEAYGNLMKDLWDRSGSVYSGAADPSRLKTVLGRFEPRFVGYHQQDAQELLSALLDRLHEDVNRVVSKPYIELKESDGRPDSIVADEAWGNHRLRNDSIIVDTFHGQFKSTVVCLECNYNSVTFDPFLFASLPIPSFESVSYNVTIVQKITTFKIQVPIEKSTATVKDLLLAVEKITEIPFDDLVPTEIYDNSVYEVVSGDELLSRFRSTQGRLQIYHAEGLDHVWVSFKVRAVTGTFRYVGFPLLIPVKSDEPIKVTIKKTVGDLLTFSLQQMDPDRLDWNSLAVIEEDRLLGVECRFRGYTIEFSEAYMRETYGDGSISDLFQPQDQHIGEHSRALLSPVTLRQCLDTFTMEERLADDWYCTRCCRHRSAFKKMDLWRLPKILIVHLKRFSYTGFWGEKISTAVEFPLTAADFSAEHLGSVVNGDLYDLIAVSNHYGGLCGGHYTAVAQNFISQKWYSFDDSYVNEIDLDDLKVREAQKSAYLLFYRRRSVIDN
jgi:ubiquitin carboxyl-terminal hydrolase 4/11/15